MSIIYNRIEHVLKSQADYFYSFLKTVAKFQFSLSTFESMTSNFAIELNKY